MSLVLVMDVCLFCKAFGRDSIRDYTNVSRMGADGVAVITRVFCVVLFAVARRAALVHLVRRDTMRGESTS